MKKTAFHGSWRITETETCSKKDIDLEKPAYIEFADDRLGEFHLLFVHGWMDCRYGTRDGRLGRGGRCNPDAEGTTDSDRMRKVTPLKVYV